VFCRGFCDFHRLFGWFFVVSCVVVECKNVVLGGHVFGA
jgi:hypothetical protein